MFRKNILRKVIIVLLILSSNGNAMSSGTVILLNGTSSAGKSAIITEFQKLFPDYQVFKVDDTWPTILKSKAVELGWKEESRDDPWMYLHEYAAKKEGRYFFSTELRQLLFDDFPSFYASARQAVLSGQNVIIDTVFEFDKEYQIFLDYFKDLNPIKVLVYCPMDILLKRVKQRNKSEDIQEHRSAFQSFEQFPAIYKIQEYENEMVVDCVKSSVLLHALNESISQLIAQNIPEQFIKKLYEFKRNFVALFKLDKSDLICLVAKNPYDLILNSGSTSAKGLVNYLKK